MVVMQSYYEILENYIIIKYNQSNRTFASNLNFLFSIKLQPGKPMFFKLFDLKEISMVLWHLCTQFFTREVNELKHFPQIPIF